MDTFVGDPEICHNTILECRTHTEEAPNLRNDSAIRKPRTDTKYRNVGVAVGDAHRSLYLQILWRTTVDMSLPINVPHSSNTETHEYEFRICVF